MPWIIFEDEDRRTPVPYFQLNSLTGESVTLDRFHGRENLVLFFAHRRDCTSCRSTLQAFTDLRGEFGAQDATILVVFPEPVEKLREDPFLLAVPWMILSDRESATRRTFANLMAEGLVRNGDGLLFVLDQYGAPYAALIDAEFDDPDIHQDVLKWLEFIGVQCPE